MEKKLFKTLIVFIPGAAADQQYFLFENFPI
jgi:hypothetical protein